VVLVLGFWAPGFFNSTNPDVDAAQSGVKQILMDDANGYGVKDVTDVKCNNGINPNVQKGATFDCEVSMDGAKRQVTVTITGADGTYEVGRGNSGRRTNSRQKGNAPERYRSSDPRLGGRRGHRFITGPPRP
jgi:hypothetical protein